MLFGKAQVASGPMTKSDLNLDFDFDFDFDFYPVRFLSGGDRWFDKLSIAIYFIACSPRFRMAGVAFYEVKQSNIQNN